MVTSSPSLRRNVGAGIEPLMVVAIRTTPVKFTGDSSITRSITLPLNSGTVPVNVDAAKDDAACKTVGKAASTPPATNP